MVVFVELIVLSAKEGLVMPIEERDHKLAELIIYVSQKCVHDSKFGSTKLNKILYFSDFLAFGKWGTPITGAEYQNLKNGPAPRRLVPVRRQLIFEQALALQPVHLANGIVQQRTVNLREARLDLFSGKEIALVDSVIESLNDLNASEASNLSHQLVGWKSTRDRETIDYRTILLSDAPLTEEELSQLKAEISENEAAVA